MAFISEMIKGLKKTEGLNRKRVTFIHLEMKLFRIFSNQFIDVQEKNKNFHV